MAEHGDTGDLVVQDFPAHEQSYLRFLWWLKYGAIISFVIAAIVVVLLAS